MIKSREDILLADGGLFDQLLAEDNALVTPFQALLDHGHRHAHHTAHHHETFMIEVAHDHNEALVLFTKQVVDRHLDVVELDESCGGSGRVRRLDLLRLDAFATRNQKNGEALFCAAAGHEVIGEHAVGDPFPSPISLALSRPRANLLGAVDNEVLAIRRLGCSGLETSDITARKGLGDSQAHLLLAREDLVGESSPERLVAQPLLHSSQANSHTGHVSILEACTGQHLSYHISTIDQPTSGITPNQLLGDDQIMQIIKLLPINRTPKQLLSVQVLSGPKTHVQNALLGHTIDQLLANIGAILLLLLRLGCHIFIGELANRALQATMTILEVRALELRSEPKGFGVGDRAQVAGLEVDDFGLLVGDDTDAEIAVFLQHFLSVQVVEVDRGILASNLAKHDTPAGVGIDEIGQIIDFVVDDTPQGVFGGVLGDLFTGEGLGHDDDGGY